MEDYAKTSKVREYGLQGANLVIIIIGIAMVALATYFVSTLLLHGMGICRLY